MGADPREIIVVQGPGSPNYDIAAGLAAQLSEIFGETVVIKVHPGASGRTATRACLNAKPDGRTICFIGYGGQVVQVATDYAAGRSSDGDTLKPVSILARTMVVLAATRRKFASLEDFLTEGRKRILNCGYQGDYPQLGIKILERTLEAMKIKIRPIPYKEYGEMLIRLEKGDEIECVVANASLQMNALIERKAVTMLGTFGKANPPNAGLRLLEAEMRNPDFGKIVIAYSAWLPPGASDETVTEVSAAVNKAVAHKEFAAVAAKHGSVAAGSTSGQLRLEVAFLRADIGKLICEARVALVEGANPFAACPAK